MPRWVSLAGLVYVVLFAVGSVLMFGGPSGDDPPAEVRRYFSDAGHRDRIFLGCVLAGLGLFAFLWFVGALREHVRLVDGGGFWTVLTTIGGAVYAAVAMASTGLNVGIRTMSDDTYRHQVFPELLHAADDAGLSDARYGWCRPGCDGDRGVGCSRLGGRAAALDALGGPARRDRCARLDHVLHDLALVAVDRSRLGASLPSLRDRHCWCASVALERGRVRPVRSRRSNEGKRPRAAVPGPFARDGWAARQSARRAPSAAVPQDARSNLLLPEVSEAEPLGLPPKGGTRKPERWCG